MTDSIARRGQGGIPLAGSRDSVPCGVWGNAPTVPRATSMPKALNKGAGSEASLPVTLRVRRRAPNLLFPSTQHCRARWARPTSIGSNSFPAAGFFVAGKSALAQKIGSSRNFGGRVAWGRVCGRAKLGAGTLRCLHLCWRLPWDWSDAEQLGRCPKPHKGRCPLTLQGAIAP